MPGKDHPDEDTAETDVVLINEHFVATRDFVAAETGFGVQAEVGIVPQVAASASGWAFDVSVLVVVNEAVVVVPRRVSLFPAVLEQQSLGPVPFALQAFVPLLVDVRATVAAETGFGVQPVVVHVTDAFVVHEVAFRVFAVLE